MSVTSVQSPSFKGVYKVTMPNVDSIKDENEKAALASAIVNTAVMGFNYSVVEPRVSNDKASVYYKVDDKNNAAFENGFKNILDECNKQFNIDVAKKVYYQKSDEQEFNKAEKIQ